MQHRGPTQTYRNLETELTGAKHIIAALVKRYGPFDLSVSELIEASRAEIQITSTVDGFHYEWQSSGDTGEKP